MRILVIDDDPTVRQRLLTVLEAFGHEAQAVAGSKDLEGWTNDTLTTFDAAIIDKKLEGDEDGLEVGRDLLHRSKIELIMLTGHGTIPHAVSAIRHGFLSFLTKPFTPDEIKVVLDEVEGRIDRIKKLVRDNTNIVGRSAAIERAVTMAARAALGDANVLITGETGTGKELFAALIHQCSHRAKRAFVKVSCAALPETLLESELFGYRRGAFTGATTHKKGRFDLADRGTIFLDEITEMSLPAQAKILRVIQEGEFEALGSEQTTSVNVRIVSATNKDLATVISEGKFREDLSFRINTIEIRLPPLRERSEDVPLLADHFFRKFITKSQKTIAGISVDALAALKSYSWPGNVRELERAIERAVALHEGAAALRVEDLPPIVSTDRRTTAADNPIGRHVMTESAAPEALRPNAPRLPTRVEAGGAIKDMIQAAVSDRSITNENYTKFVQPALIRRLQHDLESTSMRLPGSEPAAFLLDALSEADRQLREAGIRWLPDSRRRVINRTFEAIVYPALRLDRPGRQSYAKRVKRRGDVRS